MVDMANNALLSLETTPWLSWKMPWRKWKMAGNREGALKARETNKKSTVPDFYKTIGSKSLEKPRAISQDRLCTQLWVSKEAGRKGWKKTKVNIKRKKTSGRRRKNSNKLSSLKTTTQALANKYMQDWDCLEHWNGMYFMWSLDKLWKAWWRSLYTHYQFLDSFLTRNINAQCQRCNRFLHGNPGTTIKECCENMERCRWWSWVREFESKKVDRRRVKGY